MKLADVVALTREFQRSLQEGLSLLFPTQSRGLSQQPIAASGGDET
jgi:hypothetical protein